MDKKKFRIILIPFIVIISAAAAARTVVPPDGNLSNIPSLETRSDLFSSNSNLLDNNNMNEQQQLLHIDYLQPGYEPQYKVVNASIDLLHSSPSEAVASKNVTIAVAAAASSTIGLSKSALLNILANDNETGENYNICMGAGG